MCRTFTTSKQLIHLVLLQTVDCLLYMMVDCIAWLTTTKDTTLCYKCLSYQSDKAVQSGEVTHSMFKSVVLVGNDFGCPTNTLPETGAAWKPWNNLVCRGGRTDQPFILPGTSCCDREVLIAKPTSISVASVGWPFK